MLQPGQVVALCYCGAHGARRVNNVVVKRVMKTFIEIEGGSRYSTIDCRQISNGKGESGMKQFYLDSNVSYWDFRAQRDAAIRELNTAFENLIQAGKSRNWKQVKACYSSLASLIDENGDTNE